jgi:hypothetical protein
MFLEIGALVAAASLFGVYLAGRKRSRGGFEIPSLKPADARPGDVISIFGAGDDLGDLDFTADRLRHFESGPKRWFELGGIYRQRPVWMRVIAGEGAEVALHAASRDLALNDLGVTEEQLAMFDEGRHEEVLNFDGRTWLYRFSREVRCWRDGRNSQPAGFYYWEFREVEGRGLLTIRKPKHGPFIVTLYSVIPASDIGVYSGA